MKFKGNAYFPNQQPSNLGQWDREPDISEQCTISRKEHQEFREEVQQEFHPASVGTHNLVLNMVFSGHIGKMETTGSNFAV